MLFHFLILEFIVYNMCANRYNRNTRLHQEEGRAMSFTIEMKDRTLVFEDVIDLTEAQRRHIVSSAALRTPLEWRNQKSGLKIQLQKHQRQRVLAYKNSLVGGHDERSVLREQIIIFTTHAKERIALRVDRVDPRRPPKLESLLFVIKLIIESDAVLEKAEWKGNRNLVYTLYHKGYGETYKVSMSFETIGKQHMKVITVSNESVDRLTAAIQDHPHLQAELAEMKRRLLRG